MKVKFTEKVEKQVEIDVDFPVYSEHNVTGDYGPSSIIYMKTDHIDGKFVQYCVHVEGSKRIEIEVDRNYRFDRSSIDYHLGRGGYESSKGSFGRAVELAKTMLAEIE